MKYGLQDQNQQVSCIFSFFLADSLPTNEYWFYQTGVMEQKFLSVLLEGGDRTSPTLHYLPYFHI